MTRSKCFVFLVTICILTLGCLPKSRLNNHCGWADDPRNPLDIRNSAHRKHLAMDVRIAEDLGIRYGDSFRPEVGVEGQIRRREQCTQALLGTLIEVHQVTREDIARVTGVRDPWVDIITMFLPLLLLFAIVTTQMVRRVDAAFEPDEQWLKVLALLVLAPVSAGFGLMAADLWAGLVEMARLRNSHISFRAFRLPTAQHGLTMWLAGVALFGCVAAAREMSVRRAQRLLQSSSHPTIG